MYSENLQLEKKRNIEFNNMNSNTEIDVDKIIEKLLEVKGSKPGKQVNLTENEIKGLCNKSREIFISQPILLELEAPLKICGNLLNPLGPPYLLLPISR